MKTTLIGALLFCGTAFGVEPFTHSSGKMRNELVVRNQYSAARYPLAVCRADLYDVPAGTQIVVNAWGNFTNNSKLRNPGLTCELHLCDPICPAYDTTKRFDRLGGKAQGGGGNVHRSFRHHEPVFRYGDIEVALHAQHLGVEMQCRAYAMNVRGNKERVRVDDCGMSVRAINLYGIQ